MEHCILVWTNTCLCWKLASMGQVAKCLKTFIATFIIFYYWLTKLKTTTKYLKCNTKQLVIKRTSKAGSFFCDICDKSVAKGTIIID